MAIVAGGWTVDSGFVEYLDKTGIATTLFSALVVESIKQKLCDLEVAGTLSPAEKALRDSGDYSIDRVLQFIRKEPKWTRGLYMPAADIKVCIDNQWANILKRYA
jgi:hypothetical protein